MEDEHDTTLTDIAMKLAVIEERTRCIADYGERIQSLELSRARLIGIVMGSGGLGGMCGALVKSLFASGG